jgi:hypothetical protein
VSGASAAGWALRDILLGEVAATIFQLAFLGAGWVCLTRRHQGMPFPLWCAAVGVGLGACALQVVGAIP